MSGQYDVYGDEMNGTELHLSAHLGSLNFSVVKTVSFALPISQLPDEDTFSREHGRTNILLI